jgi:hypothetical protein
VYCALWLANVVSNPGVWMQDVGAAWLMPANALAGIIERRRTLLITNVWAPPSVAALTSCTFAGITITRNPLRPYVWCGSNLGRSGSSGCGHRTGAAAGVSFGSRVNGAGYNLPRALGPALRGLVLARAGASANFFLNSLTFFVVLLCFTAGARRRGDPYFNNYRLKSGIVFLDHLGPGATTVIGVGPEARLGAIQEGAWAGLLLIEGDPAKGIQVIKDY